MSDFITTHFIREYDDAVQMVLQQEGSRLRSTVMEEIGIKGRIKAIDHLGKSDVQQITNRHGDSPIGDINHLRRWYNLVGYEAGQMIDDIDKARMLRDPASSYTRAIAMGMGRAIDNSVIIPAFTASLQTGENPGDGSAATLGSGQYVADDYVESGSDTASDLTIGKLRRAKQLLDAAEVPPDDRHIAVTAQQINSLLQQPEITNADYNNIRALVQGEVNSFMGFMFHHTELLDNATDKAGDGRTVRQCPVWHRSAIELGISIDVKARVSERSDKRYNWYAYYCMFMGAGRTEDERVVIVECDESEGV